MPAADTAAESEAGGGGAAEGGAAAGPAAMELSVECADVTARLHCLLPGTLTPVAEYLELRAAVEGGAGGLIRSTPSNRQAIFLRGATSVGARHRPPHLRRACPATPRWGTGLYPIPDLIRYPIHTEAAC